MFEGQKKSVTAAHLEQLEDSDKDARIESKIISQQEYVTRLPELNDEIALAWMNNERVAALRLIIKVCFFVLLPVVCFLFFCFVFIVRRVQISCTCGLTDCRNMK